MYALTDFPSTHTRTHRQSKSSPGLVSSIFLLGVFDCVTARDKDAPFIIQFLALLVFLEQSPEKANPTEYFFNAQP